MASAALGSPTLEEINNMTSAQLLEDPELRALEEEIKNDYKLKKEMKENDARKKALNNPAMQSALLLLQLNLTNERLRYIREQLNEIRKEKQKLLPHKNTPIKKQTIKILDT